MATEINGFTKWFAKDGTVWLAVRLDERIGARRPGEWSMHMGSSPALRQLAEAAEREHPDVLAPLFAEAEKAQRRLRS